MSRKVGEGSFLVSDEDLTAATHTGGSGVWGGLPGPECVWCVHRAFLGGGAKRDILSGGNRVSDIYW